MIENMDYSAPRLRQDFPTHFTETMAERYAHNPRMIADIAYGENDLQRSPQGRQHSHRFIVDLFIFFGRSAEI